MCCCLKLWEGIFYRDISKINFILFISDSIGKKKTWGKKLFFAKC